MPVCRPILVLVFALVVCLVSATPTPVSADQETEKTALARLIHELDQLERLIQQAEASAESTERVHFQYDWLRTDIARVKAGIREYLETIPLVPRTVMPLAGDYIR